MDCRERLERPALRSAFHDGHGREPTSREQDQLKLIVLLTAAATVPWAIEHGDADFAAFGMATIERLRAES